MQRCYPNPTTPALPHGPGPRQPQAKRRHARVMNFTLACAGLLLALQAAADVAIAPLVCTRATVTVFPACSGGPTICPPGSGGPGMLQKTGLPLVTGVTGGALAGGYAGSPGRPVYFTYAVPDVRVFAPTTAKTLLTVMSSRTWVIKNSSVPGISASDFTETHAAGDVGTGLTGETTTLGSNAAGPWLLVGQVLGRSYIKGYTQYVSYGFSCTLPVQNLAPVLQQP